MHTNLRPYERPIIRLNIVSRRSVYTTESTQNGVTQELQYKLIEAHASGDIQTGYIIVDKNQLMDGIGTQEVSIREMSSQELMEIRRIPETASWFSPDKRVFATQYPTDVGIYFRECGDWTSRLNLWITEGLNKDSRLVNCIKSLIVPLTGEPTLMQPLNAHPFLITNTGAGKSSFPFLWGSKPITDAGKAGLLGSYFDGKGKPSLQNGLLHGSGFPILIDEVNTLDKAIIPALLAYIENGAVQRGLKIPIMVEGTKTIIFAANPVRNDLLSSMVSFIAKVCTLDHPERVGRRIGYLMIGNDYNKIHGQGNVSQREEVRRVIDTACRQHQQNIQQMIWDNMQWIKQPEPDMKKEIVTYAETVPNPLVRDFIIGQSIGSLQKLKTSAIRYNILEQLDRLQSGTMDFTQKEEVFHMLFNTNQDSYKKLTYFFEKNKCSNNKEFAMLLHEKFPSLSTRELGSIVGVSHTQIANWIKVT